jgi:hypothetical protein
MGHFETCASRQECRAPRFGDEYPCNVRLARHCRGEAVDCSCFGVCGGRKQLCHPGLSGELG